MWEEAVINFIVSKFFLWKYNMAELWLTRRVFLLEGTINSEFLKENKFVFFPGTKKTKRMGNSDEMETQTNTYIT